MLIKLWKRHSFTLVFTTLSFLFGFILVNQADEERLIEKEQPVYFVHADNKLPSAPVGSSVATTNTTGVATKRIIFKNKNTYENNQHAAVKTKSEHHHVTQLNETFGGLHDEGDYLLPSEYK